MKGVKMKLSVSVPTFNEIASLLEKEGVKINSDIVLTLEKGVALVPPVDYRLVTIRRDVLIESIKLVNNINISEVSDFIEFTNKLFNYVLNGKK